MSARRAALLAMALAWPAASAWPQPPVAIELHHRSAESLIVALRPLIGPAALVGSGNRLLVRAPPSDLARVVDLVRQADRPLRPLVVTLRDDPPPAAGGEAAAHAGSVTLSTGSALPADPHGNGQLLSTRPRERPNRIVEGDPLLISMPATQSLWFHANGGRAAPRSPASASPAGGPDVAGAVHFDAVSDFTARIWLAGETVAIALEPRAAGRVDSATGSDSGPSAVYGRVGQWIALVDPGMQLESPDNAGSGTARAGLWIMVDPAPGSDASP
jgi:type II/III secretion system protein